MGRTIAASLITGIDTDGQKSIQARWPIWSRHVQQWLKLGDAWAEELLAPSLQLCTLLSTFRDEQTRTPYAPDDPRGHVARVNTLRLFWRNDVMPLANELGVDTRVEQTQIRLCWKRGWFDYKVPHQKQRETPALEPTAKRVQYINHSYRDAQDKVAALHQQGLCRDVDIAQQVVKQLDLVQEVAAEAAWGLTITTAMYGSVGMLKHSNYSSTLTNELLWLEQQATTITRMSEHPATVLAELRADIIALHHTLHSMDAAHGQQEEVKKQQRIERAKAGKRKKKRQQKQEPDPLAPTQQPTLWRPDMLSQPRYSKERKQYQEHVAQRRTEIIASLSQHRGCDDEQASMFLDALLSAGWEDIINWRCAIPQQERYHRGFLMERMSASLNVHLGFLKSIYRQDIEQFLIDMQQVIDQLGHETNHTMHPSHHVE